MAGRNITGAITAVFAAVSVMLAAAGCKTNLDLTSTAGGKPYELVVSVNDQLWNGEVADSLAAVFQAPVEMINQYEPMFDMIRVQPSAVKDLILRHRNLLIINTDPTAEEPRSAATFDPYSNPQIMVTLTAKDAKSMAEYLGDNKAELQKIFNIQERNRAVAYNKKYGNTHLEREIGEIFGIEINIPQTFLKKKTEGHNFIWFGQEYPAASQGVIIYSYPYTGQDDFTLERMLKRRNEFVAHIPGPRAPDVDSHMITSMELEPEVSYLRINDRPWAEMRGFWDVKDDFMGGPFVSYSTLDTATGNVFVIEGYVYSPKDPKRNMLRALEHLVYSIKFPDDE